MDFEREYNNLIARINEVKEKPSLCMKDKHHYNGYVETGIRDALDYITSLQQEQPSLPSDLDEAAEKYMNESLKNLGAILRINVVTAFKAGAEWMAGQGVCADAEVCKLADRAWVTPLDEKLFQNEVYDKFKAGDKVVVQIRKK